MRADGRRCRRVLVAAACCVTTSGDLAIRNGASDDHNKDISRTYAVHCTSIEWLTMIATGDAAAGATALVSNEDALTAQSVSIQDLGGFTGSYMEGLQGRAQITMSGQTYTIRGTAEGFDTDNPSARTTGTFSIKVAC